MLESREEIIRNENADDDVLGAKLIDRLNGYLSPQDLLSTYEKSSQMSIRFHLEWALQASDGRRYLLNRVMDHSENHERRLACAQILASVGNAYAEELAHQSAGGTNQLDASFATQMARAVAIELGTDLVEPLLRGINSCSESAASNDPRVLADLHTAAGCLFATFDKADTDGKFEIAQTLMQISPELYRKLPFNPGLTLTLIKPGNDFQTALRQRELHLTCRFRNQRSENSTLRLVLRSNDGSATIELPIKTEIGNLTNTFGNEYAIAAKTPANAVGDYEIFLRDYFNGAAVGDGLGFALKIPANK
jgi:hypothetical protein